MAERKFYRIVELDAPPPLESLGEGESVIEFLMSRLVGSDSVIGKHGAIERVPESEFAGMGEIYGDPQVLKVFLEKQTKGDVIFKAPFVWHFKNALDERVDAVAWKYFKDAAELPNGFDEERWFPAAAAERAESERLRGIVEFLKNELTKLNAQQKGALVSA